MRTIHPRKKSFVLFLESFRGKAMARFDCEIEWPGFSESVRRAWLCCHTWRRSRYSNMSYTDRFSSHFAIMRECMFSGM
jgi:hypothetical protein